MGFAIKYQGGDQVIACYFGDGAVPEGEFHESMNLAALWKLPVIFVCENNRYAMGTSVERALAQTEIWKFGAPTTCPARRWTAWTCWPSARWWPARWPARGPRTRRRSSRPTPTGSAATPCAIRPARCTAPRTRSSSEKLRDPIVLFREQALPAGWLAEDDVRAIEKDVNDRVDEAVAFADASPEPPGEALFTDIYKEP